MNLSSVALTVVVASAVFVAGVSVFESVGASEVKWEENREAAEAYCYQAFGNPGVYSAAVTGGHGGYHCVANQDSPHYHATTREARQAALEANETGNRVDWATVDRFKPMHKRAGLIPEWIA